mmetsp:Transcript_121596/g.221207  ORF Transcript_121596/g.221207 Transcript_121596/m.221207 type:complete len:298 (+) Transcript_121596:773-1666(+)
MSDWGWWIVPVVAVVDDVSLSIIIGEDIEIAIQIPTIAHCEIHGNDGVWPLRSISGGHPIHTLTGAAHRLLEVYIIKPKNKLACTRIVKELRAEVNSHRALICRNRRRALQLPHGQIFRRIDCIIVITKAATVVVWLPSPFAYCAHQTRRICSANPEKCVVHSNYVPVMCIDDVSKGVTPWNSVVHLYMQHTAASSSFQVSWHRVVYSTCDIDDCSADHRVGCTVKEQKTVVFVCQALPSLSKYNSFRLFPCPISRPHLPGLCRHQQWSVTSGQHPRGVLAVEHCPPRRILNRCVQL